MTLDFNCWQQTAAVFGINYPMSHNTERADRWSELRRSSCYMFCREKPRVVMWIDTGQPPKHSCRPGRPPQCNRTPWWQPPRPPAGQCILPHCKNCSVMAKETWQRAQSVNLAFPPNSQSDWASKGRPGTSQIQECPVVSRTWLWPNKAWKYCFMAKWSMLINVAMSEPVFSVNFWSALWIKALDQMWSRPPGASCWLPAAFLWWTSLPAIKKRFLFTL